MKPGKTNSPTGTPLPRDCVLEVVYFSRFSLFGLCLLIFIALIPSNILAQAKSPTPLKQDENCLACHGQPGMKSDSGKSILISKTAATLALCSSSSKSCTSTVVE